VVNFVSSEGHTPRRLLGLSESSRLNEVLEIRDLTQEDAIKFLQQRGVDESKAQEISPIVGGRIGLLNQALVLTEKGTSLDGLRRHFVLKAFQEISAAGLSLPKNPSELTKRQRKAWVQVLKIYDSPSHSISLDDFISDVGDELAEDLLQNNLFSFHQNEQAVSLQSMPVRHYVRAKVGELGSKRRSEVDKILSEHTKE